MEEARRSPAESTVKYGFWCRADSIIVFLVVRLKTRLEMNQNVRSRNVRYFKMAMLK